MTTDNFPARCQPVLLLKSHPSACPAKLYSRNNRRTKPSGVCGEPLGEWYKTGSDYGKYYKMCEFHAFIYYDLTN